MKYSTYKSCNTTEDLKELNPNFVTGFCDAESSFNLIISKNDKQLSGWSVKLAFSIHLHKKDVSVLYLIQKFFDAGNITIYGNKAMYQVVKRTDILKIIKHFDTYTLKTKKYKDYLLFKQAFFLILDKKHLTKDGLLQIVSIRSSLNKGLPERLNTFFPNILPTELSKTLVVNTNTVPSMSSVAMKYWFSGFVSGEGCFFVKISKSNTHSLGKSIALNFFVVQSKIDRDLLQLFSVILGCGSYSETNNSNVGTFSVWGYKNIIEYVIPFFEKYPVLGVKHHDFNDFKQVSLLIKDKAHLTKEGLDQIILIKNNMNRKRDNV